MRDIHVQNVWMMENQQKSSPEWILARCYSPGKGQSARMCFGRRDKGYSRTVVSDKKWV